MNSITIKEENSKKGKIVAVVVILIVAILVGAIAKDIDKALLVQIAGILVAYRGWAKLIWGGKNA